MGQTALFDELQLLCVRGREAATARDKGWSETRVILPIQSLRTTDCKEQPHAFTAARVTFAAAPRATLA
jgi:hypothetical protein